MQQPDIRCLKHMARDLDLTPHALRIALRKKYGKVKGGRWTWKNGQYEKTVAVMKKTLHVDA